MRNLFLWGGYRFLQCKVVLDSGKFWGTTFLVAAALPSFLCLLESSCCPAGDRKEGIIEKKWWKPVLRSPSR